jgi:hypothetical protein
MHAARQRQRLNAKRRGLTTPIVELALLITMAGLALILDRIWLETAQFELTTAAEATALAAARELAGDDRLLPDPSLAQRLAAARRAATATASLNLVAGQPPSFDATGDDLLIGSYSRPRGSEPIVFLTDVADPTTVRITLHRSRRRNNPVALFIGQLTGIPFGDVVRQADASIDNRIEGIRPVAGGGMTPALPIALWKVDPTGNRLDTWDVQIEQRRGSDNFHYDAATRRPVFGGDGIPELALRSLAPGARPELCNLQVVDLGSGFDDDVLDRQFRMGWTEHDLEPFGGVVNPAGGLSLAATPQLTDRDRDALDTILGEPRICFLYSTSLPTDRSHVVQTMCVGLVAVRVMSVQDQGDGSCVVIVQPAVIATRSAVTSAAVGGSSAAPPNRYIYNLKLTN